MVSSTNSPPATTRVDEIFHELVSANARADRIKAAACQRKAIFFWLVIPSRTRRARDLSERFLGPTPRLRSGQAESVGPRNGKRGGDTAVVNSVESREGR